VQSKVSPVSTIDAGEAAFFGTLAEDWWNPRGTSAMLHRINPLRLAYVRDQCVARWRLDPRSRTVLAGKRALDIGCGAGLLTEPLSRMGAAVTGIDAAPENIAAAKLHAGALPIDYRADAVEDLAGEYDLVTCLEVIEHVADRPAFFASIRRLLAPTGVFVFSTPNRTPLSYATLIVGAEYVLRSIPRGAHDWQKFVRPEEISVELADAGLTVSDISGLTWRPGTGFVLGRDTSINYFGTAS
jgi:2-polyprenyl-6-hydroxyphenyl methylase/3-demethylubiquinone-9 3-methyltransferase